MNEIKVNFILLKYVVVLYLVKNLVHSVPYDLTLSHHILTLTHTL